MIRKKVCLLGAYAVGKTSLVARFVHSRYSETYHTTVGVKVDRKSMDLGDDVAMDLMLWDLAGEDEFQRVRLSYLRGAGGFLLVADGTREDTLSAALMLQRAAIQTTGDVPFALLLNKHDLLDQWEVSDEAITELEEAGWFIRRTSAKSGDGVDEAFEELARRMAQR